MVLLWFYDLVFCNDHFSSYLYYGVYAMFNCKKEDTVFDKYLLHIVEEIDYFISTKWPIQPVLFLKYSSIQV